MSKKQNGILVYDCSSERMDIRFAAEEYYGGLHCGQSFELLMDNGSWISERIEFNSEWYLVHSKLNEIEMQGSSVRI